MTIAFIRHRAKATNAVNDCGVAASLMAVAERLAWLSRQADYSPAQRKALEDWAEQCELMSTTAAENNIDPR